MVITRFAPSPTGNLNIGGVRAAIFAYLYARHKKGKFLLRIEDTDKERSKNEYEENIIESLAWLNVSYDSLFHQSEHLERHTSVLKKMIENNTAYVSKEIPTEPGGRTEVIRFKNPNRVVVFNDIVRGDISMDTSDLGDFVIAKSLEEPLFHLAVVVDDWDEGVTHVIRGEDHISNTPRQILLQEAIGAPTPIYAHLPLILGPDRSKLSKRKGAKSITEYRDMGYLPEAIFNYDAFLGWHPGGEEEVFNQTELIERFTLENVQKSGAIFDEVKLAWFNREHIARLSPEAFIEYAKQFLSTETLEALTNANLLEKLVPIMRERIQNFAELRELDTQGEFSYYTTRPSYETEKLFWKTDTDPIKTSERLKKTQDILTSIPEDNWYETIVKETLWPYAEEAGRGAVLWPLRYSLSGRDKSPDPFVIASIIGKNETIQRISQAIKQLA